MANNRRRIRSLLIGVVLGLWVLVIGTAVVWGLQNEETKLRDQVGSQLGAAGIQGLEIDVQGRDVFLAGAADADQREEAERIVRGIEGIRTIEWDDLPDVVIIRETTAPPGDTSTTTTTVPPDASATTVPPDTSSSTSTEPPIAVANISAKLDGGVLFLSGAVPDEESAARIAAVADLIYAPFVDGSVEVDPSLETASWVPNAAGVIAVLPVVGASGVEVVGESASVTGLAPTEARQAQLEGALSRALGPGVAIESTVSVSGLAPPFFQAEAPGDGSLTIAGIMPNQELADRIAGAAISVYGEENVVSDLEVQEGIDATFSLFRIPLVFVQFAPVPQWELTIQDDMIAGALKGGATFAYGSADLSPQLITLLKTAAGILIRNPTLVGTVEGHTDDIGSEGFNQTLSEARAQGAVDYLIAAGVDAARVLAVGYGESTPIGDNATEAGRAVNRRIEFFLGPAPQGGA